MGYKVSEAYPSNSNYLKASDLNKRTVAVEITSADMEDIGSDHKLVLRFRGKEKGLVLNKTNATAIAYVFGDDTDGWIGAGIELYPTMTTFQGKQVEAIRVNVRPPVAGRQSFSAGPPANQFAPPPTSAADYDEEIPF